MSSKLQNIVVDGKSINLSLLSNEQLKKLLNKLNEDEVIVKKEIDDVLSMLV